MRGNNEYPTMLDGSLRTKAGWQHLAGFPTAQDAMNAMAWHYSEGHVKVDKDNTIVLTVVSIDHHNWGSHLALKNGELLQSRILVHYVTNPQRLQVQVIAR